MSQTGDSELIDRYRSGDTAALDELVERYRRQMFSFILNMIQGTDDADEIFQEVWFRIIRKIGSYRQKNFLAWAMTISRNLVIDRWRKKKKMVSLDEQRDDGDSMIDRMADDGTPGPAAAAQTMEVGSKVSAAIQELPNDQKEVVLMRVASGLAFKEIAEIQGVSINTALARMQYGLAKLREMLKDDWAELRGAVTP